MELNWGQWKIGVVFGLISALIIFGTAVLTFETPPTWWQLVKIAVIPSCLNFLTTILQKCFPKTVNGGGTK